MENLSRHSSPLLSFLLPERLSRDRRCVTPYEYRTSGRACDARRQGRSALKSISSLRGGAPSHRWLASTSTRACRRQKCIAAFLKVHPAAPRTGHLRACIRVGRVECRLVCIHPACRRVGCRLTCIRLMGCRLAACTRRVGCRRACTHRVGCHLACTHPAWVHPECSPRAGRRQAWHHRAWRHQGCRCLRACAHPACHTHRACRRKGNRRRACRR